MEKRKLGVSAALAVLCATANAVEFSKAGYWEAEGSPRRVETLTTGWEFSLDGFKTSKRVTLPHCIDEGELGIEASGCVNRQQAAWYRRRFMWTSVGSRVPRDRARQFLHFEAIMGKSRVTLNGKPVAEHFGGFLPIHAEVTGILKEGENLLEVWCDNSDDPDYPPGKPQTALDFTYFGGIYRDAYLIETGEAYVADTDRGGVRITSNLGEDGKWTVRADVAVGGDTDDATVEVSYDGRADCPQAAVRRVRDNAPYQAAVRRVRDNAPCQAAVRRVRDNAPYQAAVRRVRDNAPYQAAANGALGITRPTMVTATFHPESPSLWTPETPNLHWLRVDVKKGGRLTDSVRVRFGIRDFKLDHGGFTLNGKPYTKKLIGANRHQDYAFIGMALPNSLHWRDVKKFKDCGMTVFRCAHYPQDPAFMDACDEMGMFVIVATPGWQFWNKKNPEFERRVYDDIEKMVRRDRSRPSLLMWEPILNETYFPGRFVTNAVAVVKREALAPNAYCGCDLQSAGSSACEVNYCHHGAGANVSFRREWGDYVDDWSAQNSPSRVPWEWGERPMVVQATHYMWMLDELLRDPPHHFGACLWHGCDHARGYHPDNFYGGIMTYARQKKYSWYAFKAALTEKPFVYVAHELAFCSPEDVTVFSNCSYKATLVGEPFKPGETKYDYRKVHGKAVAYRKQKRGNVREVENFKATLADGTTLVKVPAKRCVKIALALDTEGLAPVADGGDLVAVTATLSDGEGNPKRYETETIRFSVEGEADIVGTNPQVTRWGEAVVLIRPRASAKPKPIKVRAATIRQGRYAPAVGTLEFTPGAAGVRVSSAKAGSDEAIRAVGRQQQAFEL